MTVEIQRRSSYVITIIDDHIGNSEYIKSIESSIVALCYEGFLPWSPGPFESIQIGFIPIILADNIVLPFERFIDWRALSAKNNISSIKNITNLSYRIQNLEEYTKEKLRSVLPYLIVTEEKTGKRIFKAQNDKDDTVNRNIVKSLVAQRI
jgi:hypothetical protein